jgi:mannose-6-phosphate isomerase-like protein (cupin superfamily)
MSRENVSGDAYWLLGSLAIVHVSGERTEDRCCLVEFLSPPDDMLPLHVHRRDSQTTYVLEGEVTFYLPGESRVLGPGECIHQPAGVPQTERVTSAEPGRVLDVNSPAGFDRFVASAGEQAASRTLPPSPDEPPDFERLVALAADHGVDILGPPGTLP